MSRKDYERIAGVLGRYVALKFPAPAGFVAAQIADSLAFALEIDNPRFDRSKFLAACNVADWRLDEIDAA